MASKPKYKAPKDFVVRTFTPQDALAALGCKQTSKLLTENSECVSAVYSADGELLRLTIDYAEPSSLFDEGTLFQKRLYREMKELAELKSKYESFVMFMGVIDSDIYREHYANAVRREATMAFAIQSMEQSIAALKRSMEV